MDVTAGTSMQASGRSLPLALFWAGFDNVTAVVAEASGYTSAHGGGDASSNSADVDGDSAAWQCPLFRFVLNTLVMGVTCLLGIVCNGLSAVVLRGDRRAPVAAFLLRSLAVADSCYLVLWLVNFSCRDLVRYLDLDAVEHHVIWLLVRVYTYPGLFVAQSAVIWLTVVIALNRYLVACRPDWLVVLRRYPRLNVRVVVAAVTALAVAYNVPRYCELYVTLERPGNWSRGRWNKTTLGSSALYKLVYVDILYYVISFVMPLITLVYVSCCVIGAYRAALRYRSKGSSSSSGSKRGVVTSQQQHNHKKQQRHPLTQDHQLQQHHNHHHYHQHTHPGASGDTDNNITFVMIVVVLVFMMCQSPARLVQIVWSYSYTSCRQFQFYVIQLSNTLEVLNSSTNFVIYCLFYRRFRRKLQRRLCAPSPCVAPASAAAARDTTTGAAAGGGADRVGDITADTTERLALVTMGDLLLPPQPLSSGVQAND